MAQGPAFISAPEGDLFAIETHPIDSGHLLSLAGPIGMEAAPRLQAEAQRLAARSGGVALDWGGAEYVSAGAVQVLLALAAALQEGGRKLRVAADHPGIRELLERAGISGWFPAERAE
jgi:anti-anti-sigma factor